MLDGERRIGKNILHAAGPNEDGAAATHAQRAGGGLYPHHENTDIGETEK